MACVFTREEILEQIEDHKRCLKSVLLAQDYVIGNRKMTKADLATVEKALKYWADQLDILDQGSGPRFFTAVSYR